MSTTNLTNSLTEEEADRLWGFQTYLREWCRQAEAKFIKGILEHRGEPPMNPRKELEEELMDILAYNYFAFKGLDK